MICIVGCQEEGVSGDRIDAVTQVPSPVLHPKAVPRQAQAIKLSICPRFLTASAVVLKSHQSRGKGRHLGHGSFCSPEFSMPLTCTALSAMLLPTDYHTGKKISPKSSA